jgi:hypothetical protein
MSFAFVVTTGLLLLTLSACGGSGSKAAVTPSVAPIITVAVTPKTTTLGVGAAQTFAAAVTGTTNTAVTWTVTESTGGTIDSTGKYTAAGTAGIYHVVATSVASAAVSDTATVTVTAPVTVTIAPKTASVKVGATQAFTAAVTGTTNTAISWSVTEPAGGSIDSTGKYTAAAQAGTYHVVATSQASTKAFDTATVTVTAPPAAPAPTFTSTAPVTASEGTPYSYTVTATDPSGTGVTYALTTSTTATISGNTVTWTPLSSESRTSDSFTVTATTGAGGIATQSWTVSPSGNITVSQNDTYFTANGPTPTQVDISGYTIAAWVPNGDGTFTTIAGAGNQDGTVTIPGVPAGYYWLNIADDSESFWTSSSTFELGANYDGRQGLGCDYSTSLTLTNLTGFDSSTTADSNLIAAVLNQNSSYLNTAPSFGTITAGSTDPLAEGSASLCNAIDPTSGDTAYVIQQESVTLPSGLTGLITGPALMANPDGTVSDSSTLTSVMQPLDIQVQGPTFANVGPEAVTFNQMSAMEFMQPFVSDRSASALSQLEYSSGPITQLWYLSGTPPSTSDAGMISYNNPYTSPSNSWLPVFSGLASATAVDSSFSVQNMYATTTPQTNGPDTSVFAPIMSPIQNPTINGTSLFTTTSSDTTSVVLSWTAPSDLAPYGYEIYYQCVDQSCPDNSTGYLYTSGTSITFPPGLLTQGYDYAFDIGAMADSLAKMESSPWRSGYPQAWADVESASIMMNISNDDAVRIKGAVVRAAQKNQVTRTKTGSYLVTKSGMKALDGKARMLARFNRTPKVTKAASAAK